MEKNITVVDEQGNQYEATYPKRAKGLVKHGRARFVDEYTICLACPPQIETEDNTMSENTTKTESMATKKYTIEYILEQIEKIAADTAYLLEAVKECSNPVGGEACAMALGNMVEHREKTNRQLIAFYQEVYSNLKSAPVFGKEWYVEQLMGILRDDVCKEDKDRAERIIREYMHS